jgi:hypothetical protein
MVAQYCIFCGMDFFWAVIRVIMFVSNVTNDAPSKAWQFYIYVGTLIAAPLIYVLTTYLSYQVYKELKNTGTGSAAYLPACTTAQLPVSFPVLCCRCGC